MTAREKAKLRWLTAKRDRLKHRLAAAEQVDPQAVSRVRIALGAVERQLIAPGLALFGAEPLEQET